MKVENIYVTLFQGNKAK